MYQALYRRYRPQTFNEVIGQAPIVKTLCNQIEMGKIGHAYLFTGSRGTGKTSTAKIFARAINCQNPKGGIACGKCEPCKLGNGNIDIVEIDAASNNGVDEIRDLREQVKYPPVNGKYKVYIIDEVHMLSVNAFNALLKTLEEPPEFVVFILATTEVHKLPATILSRCMRFDFRLVSVDELVKLLTRICKENAINAETAALNIIARAGEGSVRDTLSVADRCIAFCGNNLTAAGVAEVLGVAGRDSIGEIVSRVLAGNVGEMLIALDKVLSSGKSAAVLAKDIISYFRDLVLIATVPERAREMVIVGDKQFEVMKQQSLQLDKAMAAIEILSSVEQDLRYSVQPRVVLECNLIKVMANENALLRIAAIEKKLQNQANFNENMAKNTQFCPNNENAANNNRAAAAEMAASAPVKVVQGASEAEIKTTATNASANANSVNSRLATQVTNATSGVSDEVKMVAELVRGLQKEKVFSLAAMIEQVRKVGVDGKLVELVVDDDTTAEMVMASKFRPLVDEFFKARGLDYKIVSKAKASPNCKDTKGLSALLK